MTLDNPAHANANPAISAGKVLGGRYRLISQLGEGGMAVVWRVFDLQLNREVALKVLHEHVLPVDRKRFGREIRTLAKLHHAGVVTIHDLGNEGVQLYFTMELLEGGPLSQLGPLEDSALELAHFVQVALEATVALGYIHAAGIVHRDLTPQNILLGQDGSPRIMDFGLIYLSDATRDLTRSGYTLGTPEYMAPEQAKGGLVTPATDFYALGAVLYRSAAGKPLFIADNDQGILYQHVYEAPLPLESRNASVPCLLADTIGRFLAKDPAQRPANPRLTFEECGQRLRHEHVPSQYRGGRARSGVYLDGPSQDACAAGLTRAWELPLGGEVSWPAAITGNGQVLACGTRNGKVVLFEPRLGLRFAEFQAGDEVTAPISFDGPNIVFAAWDHVVRCLDWRSGQERWRHRTRAEITAAPTRVHQRWLIASRDGDLHALGLDGSLAWVYRAGHPIAATPTLWAGQVIVTDEDGWLHALDPESGKARWKLQSGGIHATVPATRLAGTAGVLLLPTWDGELQALALDSYPDGPRPRPELLWAYGLEGEVWSSPAVVGNTVVAASWSGELRALDLATGDDRWSLALHSRLTASPVIAHGVAYAASESGEVVAVRISDGLVLWRHKEREAVQGTPLVSENMLIVPFLNGLVRAYK
jgi:eukaryotic-like serine/threonine-protein kinase